LVNTKHSAANNYAVRYREGIVLKVHSIMVSFLGYALLDTIGY